MTQSFDAVYDGLVLRPESALPFEPNTRVRVTVEVIPAKTASESSFLRIARSLELEGPVDWSTNLGK